MILTADFKKVTKYSGLHTHTITREMKYRWKLLTENEKTKKDPTNLSRNINDNVLDSSMTVAPEYKSLKSSLYNKT